MNLPTMTEVPLREGGHGVMLVGNKRVPLETVIWRFNQGDSPEDIIQHFTSLELADVYAVIGYYLHHREDVDAYMRERKEASARLRAEVEARHPLTELRARILKLRGENS